MQQRLDESDLEIARQQLALKARRDKLRDNLTHVLQLEASLVELGHENDATEHVIIQKEMQLDERVADIEQREQSLMDKTLELDNASQENSLSKEAASSGIDERWHSLDDSIRIAEGQLALEIARLKKNQKELDDRESLQREKQRELNEREQSMAAWQRRIKVRRSVYLDRVKSAFDRLEHEMREREEFFHSTE